MGFLQRLFRGRKSRKSVLAILGSSKAGKTTLVRYLETGKPVTSDVPTTLGVDIRRNPISINNWMMQVIDVGGQQIYQQAFWELSVQQADAVIYVIDGTVHPDRQPDLFEIAREQLHYVLKITDTVTPILILVNKQDLEGALGTAQTAQLYDIHKALDRTIILLPISAKYGTGVDKATLWLVETLDATANN